MEKNKIINLDDFNPRNADEFETEEELIEFMQQAEKDFFTEYTDIAEDDEIIEAFIAQKRFYNFGIAVENILNNGLVRDFADKGKENNVDYLNGLSDAFKIAYNMLLDPYGVELFVADYIKDMHNILEKGEDEKE